MLLAMMTRRKPCCWIRIARWIGLALLLVCGDCAVPRCQHPPPGVVVLSPTFNLPEIQGTRFPPYGGGSAHIDGDDDDYGENDDGYEEDDQRRRTSRSYPPPRARPQQQAYKRPQQHQRRRHHAHHKNPIQSLAEKSIGLTTKTALGTVRQSGKAAYYLIKPKHVEREELIGLWRMDQSVQLHPTNAGAIPLECSANIELTRTSVLVASAVDDGENDDDSTTASDADDDDDKVLQSRWKFKPAQWPRAAKVEFVARAFVIESARTGKKEQLLFLYKGQVDRKLAARNVIKIKGKIYRIEKTGWRGKNTRHVPVGTFVARRRLRIEPDVEDEDFEEGEESGWESDDESDHDDERQSGEEGEWSEEDDYEEDAGWD